MSTPNELDLTIYTKKGTLRKRKPKKNKNYFTQDTEDAIIEFVASTDDYERNKIYRERIHYAFTKLTENLIHTYKYYYTDNHSIEELQHNTIIFLLERLGKFKAGKGKAYSYFGTIAKRYLILNNKNNYEKLKSHYDINEINDDKEIEKELIIDDFKDDSLFLFFDIFIKYVDLYLDKLFTKDKEKNIANAVLELFRKRENIDIFNKKALYIFIKEQVDEDTTSITKVIKQMKDIYGDLYNQYSQDGFVKKLT